MRVFVAVWMLCLLGMAPVAGAELFVSASTGDNGNDGSQAKPFKNLEKALTSAKAGDVIKVAEGNYFGLRGTGYLEAPVPVTIHGGYSPDFATRDVLKHQTLIQPDNESAGKSRKALLTLMAGGKDTLFELDGLIFDMGQRNSYSDTEGKPEGVETGMLLLPPAFNKEKDKHPTVTEACLRIAPTASEGNVTVRNCVFLNGANFGIQAGHKGGVFKVLNCVFVSNRMAAIEIYGTGGKKGPKGPTESGGDVEIAHNTILFTWSRLKDFQDMGYGVRIMTLCNYNIHHNLIGLNALTGLDHTRFNPSEWVKVEHNQLFLNKQADMMFTAPGQGQFERVSVKDFGDLGLAAAQGNTGDLPAGMPIHKGYMEGFLSARYTEEADYDPESPANRLREAFGLNKQGKLTTEVSMFANRYPLEDALKLFGAKEGLGAQKPQ